MASSDLPSFFRIAETHRIAHECGGVPYACGSVLTTLVSALKPKRILEVGTGIGYSAACLAAGFENAHIDTIDQDSTHLDLARAQWQAFGISGQITAHKGKAEAVLPTLSGPYQLIFFDGYTPSMKFLLRFDDLLERDGMLITANLFLSDPKGGAYLRTVQNPRKWQTGVFADTALSVKL